MKAVREILEHSPFFEVIGAPHLDFLSQQAEWRSFKQGELLIEQGAPADRLYLLVSGHLRLFFRSPIRSRTGAP